MPGGLRELRSSGAIRGIMTKVEEEGTKVRMRRVGTPASLTFGPATIFGGSDLRSKSAESEYCEDCGSCEAAEQSVVS